MVENDCIEVPAVVMFDEVLGGVGRLQAPSPHTLMLQQSLVQGEEHLAEKREGCQGCSQGQAGLWEWLSTLWTLGLSA